MSSSKKIARLLCFGDSLTEGWYHNGYKFHPYTNKLAELLNSTANGRDFELVNRGISGEFVYPEMAERLSKILEKEQAFDFAIILGGTNDLSDLQQAKKIDLFKKIEQLHQIAHNQGVKTCALTIPQASFDMLPHFKAYVQYREDVNEKIRSFVTENSNMVCLCDLSKQLPMFGINECDLSTYWDDDLHFSPQGYDKMAELIFDAVKDQI